MFFRGVTTPTRSPATVIQPRDWDAPLENVEENPEAYDVPQDVANRSKQRKRRLLHRDDSESPPPKTLSFQVNSRSFLLSKSNFVLVSLCYCYGFRDLFL